MKLFKNLTIITAIATTSGLCAMGGNAKQNQEASAAAQAGSGMIDLSDAFQVNVKRLHVKLLSAVNSNEIDALTSILQLLTVLETFGIKVKKEAINMSDNSLNLSPFLLATGLGRFEAVKLLVQNGANLQDKVKPNEYFKASIGENAYTLALERSIFHALIPGINPATREELRNVAIFLEPLMGKASSAPNLLKEMATAAAPKSQK